MPPPQKQKNTLESIKVGCLAGATEALINHPLYVLKMRYQADNKSFRLYHGLLPNMATMVLLTGIRLSLSTQLTEIMDQKTNRTNDQKKLISSFAGGTLSSIVGSPLEFIRYRQLVTKSTFHAAMRNLYYTTGLQIFATGLVGTALRDSIYTIGFFSLAPMFKKHLKNNNEDSLRLTIFSGALAGLFAGVASQPFDMTKTNQQTHFAKGISLKSSFTQIYDKHGISGFFKGSLPRIARVTSGVTIISTINDYFNNKIEQTAHLTRGLG